MSESARPTGERILLYGGPKAGKSTCWLELAAWMHAKDKPGTFYLLDSDYAWARAAAEKYQYLEDEGRIVVYDDVGDYPELLEAAKEVSRRSGPGDFHILDMSSYYYDMVQEYYSERVFGQDLGMYFAMVRRDVQGRKKKGEGGDSRQFGGFDSTEWVYIRKMYNRIELPLTLRTKAHVIAIAEERQVVKEREGEEVAALYRKAGGYAPVAYKKMPHRFHTILRVVKRSDDTRELLLVGDRQRENIWAKRAEGGYSLDITIREDEKGRTVGGFHEAYLRRIARWKP